MNLRSALSGLLASVVVATALTAGVTPAAQAAPGGRAYVGMGDSFAANPTIPQQVHGWVTDGCGKSNNAYPDRVGHQKFGGDFVNLACNGVSISGKAGPGLAWMADMAAGRGELGERTRVVTITAGGAEGWNLAVADRRDFGFIDGANYVNDDEWVRRMAPVVGTVKRHAPNATVYIVGYPETTGPGNQACIVNAAAGPDANIPLSVPVNMGILLNKLNGIAARTAGRLGVTYIDTFRPGTGLCAHPDRQWVHSIIDIPGENDRMPFHPNSRGDQALADIVMRETRG